MEAKEVLFKRLIDDEKLKLFLNKIKEICGSFGEDNDEVLDFLYGVMINFYIDPKNALVNLDFLKYSLIAIMTGSTLDFITSVRDKKESKIPLV